MTELTPMSTSKLALEIGLSVAQRTTRGSDEESLWGSDWESDWLYESDWESDNETKQAVARQQTKDDDSDPDSENEVLRVKSMKRLISDDSPGRHIPPSKARRRVVKPADEDALQVDDDGDGEDDDDDDDVDDTDSEESAPGLACHFCKLRNAKRKVQCSRCPIRFCGLCLQNRNGEQLEVEIQERVNWVCPKCRTGCGPGCNNCCTCAPCRKSQGLAPAGQVIRIARQVGFDNVHDYLIHRQTGESPAKIAKRKKGRGWTKAGGAMNSSYTGVIFPKLKSSQLWTTADCVPANHGRVGLWNENAGLAWTIPEAMNDIMKSTNNDVKPGDGKMGVAILPFGGIKKPANGTKASKFTNDEPKGPLNEHKKVLDHVLGRVAQKPELTKSSLDQIVNRLLHPGDESGQDRSGTQQKWRNRKHRKMGRILEPSMFRNRKSKTNDATKPREVTPEFVPTASAFQNLFSLVNHHVSICPTSSTRAVRSIVKVAPDNEVRKDNADIDQCSKETISAKQQSDTPPTVQIVPDTQHGQASLEASVQLKRPITSLQALRKMGILAKRNHAYFASEDSSQQQGPAIAPSPLRGHSNQILKQSSKVGATSPPVRPSTSSECGSQATSLRHLERRKKKEFLSCSKSQHAIPAIPAGDNLVKERIVWRGGLPPRQSGPHSGFGQFSKRRSVTGFELPRKNGTQSGFESFSQKETLIGFGSFNGEGKAGLSALRT